MGFVRFVTALLKSKCPSIPGLRLYLFSCQTWGEGVICLLISVPVALYC